MDKSSALQKILLVYIKKIENFHKVISSFDGKLALLRQRKKHNLLILQNLMKQQLLLLSILDKATTKRSLWKLVRERIIFLFN